MLKKTIIAFFVVIGSLPVFAQGGAKYLSDSSSDSLLITKTRSAKDAVKLYPNPSYGKVSVSTNTSSELHFYIFDLEGTMVYQTVLNSKTTKTIDNLKKGTYLYDVFEKDESIEEGKIIIK